MKILDVPQSGSVAGVTSSRNRFGQYRRTRAMPVNPATPKQNAVRVLLADISRSWRDLAAEVKQAWTEWAIAHPTIGSLGETIVLTGHQAYVSANALRASVGEAIAGTLPSDTAKGLNPCVPGWASSQLRVSGSEDLGEGILCIVEAAPAHTGGKSFIQGWRRMGVLDSEDTDPTDYTASYTALFGAPTTGQVLPVRLSLYSNGTKDTPQSYQVAVVT
jgi:hypothetical protein